jgi:hypothetical protein
MQSKIVGQKNFLQPFGKNRIGLYVQTLGTKITMLLALLMPKMKKYGLLVPLF